MAADVSLGAASKAAEVRRREVVDVWRIALRHIKRHVPAAAVRRDGAT